MNSHVTWTRYTCCASVPYPACFRAVSRRRHFADAADADHNWSARRRRRRPNVGVAPAPFSWRVHVMLYTSYMLLDFCNAFVYKEAWTLTKSSKNDAGVFCNSPWYSNETRQRQSKSVFVDNFVKMISQLKVSYGTSWEIWLIKQMVQWKISIACTVITAYKVAKSKRTDTVSTKNLSQHSECLVKTQATSSTLFVRVNTGVTENAGMENAKRSKSDNGKLVTDTHYWIQHLTKTYDTYFRSL